MKTAITALATAALLTLSATAQAQSAKKGGEDSKRPPQGQCVYASKTYSPGSYLCVAAGTVNKCDATGKAWTAEDSPTCKGPSNP